ncbi:uncharacterized protein LOC107040388 [Diachasma alloeum]|uniref:uncharacterized protein LOC107040388 n=1 Tax=Diachasma alloeum TaxID=454923 RepID=UPI0010FBBDF6|nr:uncharacterized protein LOC107040388 [Diachasma alloeum]XP_028982091.1 uncharacterized protein LOC107040388 [Diachasma alloeum]
MATRKKKNYNNLSRRQQLRRLEALKTRIPVLKTIPLTVSLLSQGASTLHDSTSLVERNSSLVIPSQKLMFNEVIDEYRREGIREVDREELEGEEFDAGGNAEIEGEESGGEKFGAGGDEDDEEIVSDESPDSVFDLKKFLRVWHLKHKISQTATSDLLKGLQQSGQDLPATTKTLLSTPKRNQIRDLGTGKFAYYGLEKAICDQLRYVDLEAFPNVINLFINVDGVPISKSSKSELWPILGKIEHLDNFDPFVIAIYHGTSKPESVEVFLDEFIDEYFILNEEGFHFKNRHYRVHIKAFLTDTPARNFLLCFPAHNSRCASCIQEGITIQSRRLFLEIKGALRTDDNFRVGLPDKFQNVYSPLEYAGFSMTTQFPLDYLHLLCLGVMKKLLLIWYQRIKSPQVFSTINGFFCSLGRCTPSDFPRKPRTLEEVTRWKATEFRLFLLYLGPILVPLFLDERKVIHFNSLNCAVRILCDPNLCESNNEYANQLMEYFVEMMEVLYTKLSMIFNVHNCLHLANYVKLFGPLDAFSCFPFENQLQIMKNLIKSGALPLAQIMNRMIERATHLPPRHPTIRDGFTFLGEKKNCELPPGYYDAHRSIQFSNFVLADHPPENCCYLRNGSIVLIQTICFHNKNHVIIGREIINSDRVENYPCDSRNYGIHKFTELSELKTWPTNDITRKGFVIPFGETGYVFPIIHCQA